MKLRFLVYLVLILFSPLSPATPISNDQLYSGDVVQKIDTQILAESILPGSIVILGELHGLGPHQDKQVEFMRRLRSAGRVVSVGMEFLSYPFQDSVDAYVRGELSENDFLQQIKWGGNDFSYYRRQILFSGSSGGRTIALNAPRDLTGKVARSGVQALTDQEKELLPPNFTLGNQQYFERFWQMVGGHHVPREKVENYFAAQSIWDDTMAWQAVSYIEQNPQAVLAIVVGDFHVMYGGGLPDRLLARGATHVVSISQINLADYANAEEARQAIQPHPRWGKRADYIWTSYKAPQRVFNFPSLLSHAHLLKETLQSPND